MTDPRTQAYLRELAKAQEQNRKVVDMAVQICTCNACIEERMKNAIPPCELNKRMQEVHDMIIPPNPSNFFPELSPDWNPKTGTLESNNRPVGMIST